jgi:hypothetical protein
MSPKRRAQPDEDHVEAVLRRFVRDFPEVVLIGGWASYLRVGVAKSHDIDIIVDHATLAKIGAKFQLAPSHHISGQKFAMEVEGVGVDVYPVDQSRLGRRLQMPVEVLIRHTDEIDRTRVLTAEAQFVAKLAALLDRPDTLPGEKDRREIWELINSDSGLNFKAVSEILVRGGWPGNRQTELLDEAFDLLGETVGLSKNDRAKLGLYRARALEAGRSDPGRDQDPGR